MKQRGKKSIFFKNFEILSKTCWDTLYYMAAEILTLEWIGIRRSTKELQKRKHRNFVVKRPKMQKFAFALGIDNPYLVPKGHQNSIEALVLIQYLKCHLKEGLSKISSSSGSSFKLNDSQNCKSEILPFLWHLQGPYYFPGLL